MRLLSGRLMRSWWPAGFAGLVALFCVAAPVAAQINVSIGAPSVDIGIHFPGLPSLTLVSGSPVYYAPQADANFFFYDGMYWVYRDDNWYASSWYNGPWAAVDPDAVPDVVLQVPVIVTRCAPRRCLPTSASIPGSGIRRLSNSRPYTARTTSTSRTSPSCSSTMRNTRRRIKVNARNKRKVRNTRSKPSIACPRSSAEVIV